MLLGACTCVVRVCVLGVCMCVVRVCVCVTRSVHVCVWGGVWPQEVSSCPAQCTEIQKVREPGGQIMQVCGGTKRKNSFCSLRTFYQVDVAHLESEAQRSSQTPGQVGISFSHRVLKDKVDLVAYCLMLPPKMPSETCVLRTGFITSLPEPASTGL